jgi:hypothetical protein
MRILVVVAAILICPLVFWATPDCTGSADTLNHVTVAAVTTRLIKPIWPPPPPGARVEGYAVFQVRVSAEGKVACISSVGGQTLLLSVLKGSVQSWRFRPGPPFVGLVAIRYSSMGYQLL